MSTATFNVNLGKCLYCDSDVDYEITYYRTLTDCGWESDSNIILACNKDDCVLNHLDSKFYSDWDDVIGEYDFHVRLIRSVEDEWKSFIKNLSLQIDLLSEVCEKLIKEKINEGALGIFM